jgi:biotin carboxyl carrier protein
LEYRLKINEETLPVEVENSGRDGFRAQIRDRVHDVEHRVVSDHQIHLNVNGRRVNAYVCDQDNGKIIFINGRTWFVSDADLAEPAGTRKKGPGAGLQEVTPPMPAIVISVAVAQGDAVKKGQAVVIVSAMKMETTLFAPFDGTVTKVNVCEGDKVMPGDILVDIKKAGPDSESEAE